MLRSFLLPLVFAFLVVAAAPRAHAAVITVSSTTDAVVSGTNQGCTGAGPWVCPSLRAAISRANALGGTNTINLSAGTYKITVAPGTVENANASGDFDIRSSLTINGAAASTTTISGENVDRVFEVWKPLVGTGHNTVTIKNVTITKGNSSSFATSGGAIINRDLLTLQSVTISNSSTARSSTTDGTGGAIYNTGTLTLTSATLSGNAVTDTTSGETASWGGAIYSTGAVTISGSTFSGNYAKGALAASTNDGLAYGGAIAMVGATLIVSDTTFTNNRFNSSAVIPNSRGNGAAIYVSGGTLSLTGGSFSGNVCGFGDGGALRSINSTVTLTDTDLQSNSSLGRGGAIAASGTGSLAISGTSIRTNSASYDASNELRVDPRLGGGGVWLSGALTLTIDRSQLSANTCDGTSDHAPPGGGIAFASFTGAAKIANTTFRNNNAKVGLGGGIALDAQGGGGAVSTGTVELVNCTLDGNNAAYDGAGIFSSATSPIHLRSCTVAHNLGGNLDTATSAGIYGGYLHLENTVIGANTNVSSGDYADVDGATITSTGYNVVGVDAGPPWVTATDRVGQDPLLFAAKSTLTSDGTTQYFVPFDVSGPLFEAGNPLGCTDLDGDPLAYDIRRVGYPRSVDGDGNGNARCDIGSYEVGSLPIVGFSATTYSADEGAGTVTITVKRIGSTAAATSIDYATANGTATAGTDYTAKTGTLSWAAGDATDKTFTITLAADDSTVDGNKTVNLTLADNLTSSNDLGPATAVLTILDNDAATTVRFSAVDLSIGEAAGSVTLSVQRVGASAGAVSVKYKTTNGSAAAGSDYTSTTGTVSFGAGETGTKTFTVPITSDSLDEADETFTVTLYEASGAALGASEATVTIVDDDTTTPVPGTIAFTTATFTVAETYGNLYITASRTGGSDGAVTVDYATANGTASSPSDFSGTSGTLSWANGEIGDKQFFVPIVNDVAHENAESFTAKLSNITGGATLGTSTATVNITDDDPAGSSGTIGFSAATYSFNENGGFLTITATRSGGSTGQSSVEYASSDGTALSSSDFGAVSGTLTWLDGQSGDKTFTIGINDDSTYEGDETFGLALANVTNSALGTSVATVTIVENDPKPVVPGTITFDETAMSVNENAGTLTVTFHRTGGKDGALALTLKSSNGSASAPGDFTAVTHVLTWADQDAADKTATITILDDAAVEGDEAFSLGLTVDSGGATLGNGPATVTIVDDDSAGQLALTNTSYVDAVEGEPTVSIEVKRIDGSSGAVSVVFETADSTATAPSDYTAKTVTLTWADGDTANKVVTIVLANDLLFEGPEEFKVTLRDPTGGATLGTSSAVVQIGDNDPSGGYLGFLAAETTGAESDGVVRFTVRRTGTTTDAVTVHVVSADGTATAPADYAAVDQTLSWTAGDTTDRFVDVALVHDATSEPTEDFSLQLKSPTGGAQITAPTATGKITNSAPPATGTLALSASSYTVAENGGSVTITVSRTGGSAGVSTVNYATSDATATAGSDYTTKTGTLTWANGDSADKTFAIAITNDASNEGNESFGVTLSGATNSALGTSTASITITEDDLPGNVGFAPTSYSVGEAGGSVVVTLHRSAGKSGAVGVTVKSNAGTASAGSDFTAVNQVVTWADQDDADKTVTVSILNDSAVESGESFSLTLSAPTGGVAIESTATIDIVDDDSVGKIGFSSASYSMTEGEGAILLTVKRTGGSSGAVSATFTTSDGSATSANDYTATTTSVSWVDGDFADKTVLVPFNNDLFAEPNEAFTVTLSSPTGGATLAIATATVGITNDDPNSGYLSFVASDVTATEASGTIRFSVHRTGTTSSAVSVVVATQIGSAEAGVDYVDKTQTLSWGAGDTADKHFDVVLLGDGVTESDETFLVDLDTASGDAVILTSSATATITDSTAMPDLLGAFGDLAAVDLASADDLAGATADMAAPTTTDLAASSEDLAAATPDLGVATADLGNVTTPDLDGNDEPDAGTGKPKSKGCSTEGPLDASLLAVAVVGALLLARRRRATR